MSSHQKVVIGSLCVGTLMVAGTTLLTVFDKESNQMPSRRWGPLAGVVIDQNSRPVAGARISGEYRVLASPVAPEAVTDADGRFEVERALLPLVLHAATSDGILAGISSVESETGEVTIHVGPTAELRGRLLDSNGAALSAAKLQCGVQLHFEDEDAFLNAFGSTTTTDDSGRYTLRRLALGQTYTVTYAQVVNGSLPTASTIVATVTPDAAEIIDVGNTVVSHVGRYSINERMAMLFNAERDLAERIDAALADTAREKTRVLLVFAVRESQICRNLVELLYEDHAVRSAFWDYECIGVDVKDGAAGAVAREYNVDIAPEDVPVLAVVDSAGTLVTTRLLDRAGAAMRDTVLKFLTDNALELSDAEVILANALETAKRDEKRVFVRYSAAWCGPCRKLSRFLDAQSEVLNHDYVHVRIDLDRSPHAAELMNHHCPGPQCGIPWYAILDAEGRVLVTSDGADGNIGFPSETADIDHFLSMLEQTAIRLTDDNLQAIRHQLSAR